jgi:hypothetical protein
MLMSYPRGINRGGGIGVIAAVRCVDSIIANEAPPKTVVEAFLIIDKFVSSLNKCAACNQRPFRKA